MYDVLFDQQGRRYARCVGDLIKAQLARQIKGLSAAAAGGYFDVIDREDRHCDWQTLRRVDAIRLSCRWLLVVSRRWYKKAGIH